MGKCVWSACVKAKLAMDYRRREGGVVRIFREKISKKIVLRERNRL